MSFAFNNYKKVQNRRKVFRFPENSCKIDKT